MVRIVPVNLSTNPKTLWFDAGDLDIEPGDGLVVTTARGMEFARAADEIFEASDAQLAKLRSPLKSVKRKATPEDEQLAADLQRKSEEALPVFREMAEEMAIDMRPVSVEFLLDGEKAVFYFESDERVDFRDLVRKLASHFHVRVDMRQIGVRDEARMVGGLGHCGQELCCKRLGSGFCPVSIRMAKEQNLSLNPQKISGLCGRLMCCLRYEYDAYRDFNKRAPKRGSTVSTPDGPAKVVDLDVPREVVSVRAEGGKPVKVPLADFEPPHNGTRPTEIGDEAWEAAVASGSTSIMASAPSLLSGQLTAGDRLADPKAVHHAGASGTRKGSSGGSSRAQKQAQKAAAKSSRRDSQKAAGKGGRPGQASRKHAAGTPSSADEYAASGRVPRRRRSTKLDTSASPSDAAQTRAERGQAGKQHDGQKQGQARKQTRPTERAASGTPQKAGKGQGKGKAVDGRRAQQQAVRPGQGSSGVRAAQGSRDFARGHGAPDASGQGGQSGQHRRKRVRKPSSEGGQGAASGHEQ